MINEYTYESLKKAINKQDLKSAVEGIGYLYIFDEEDFRRNLLLSGCLADPLGRKFSEDKLDFFSKACAIVLKSFQDGEYEKGFQVIMSKMIRTIRDLNNASKSNEKRLFKNDFLNYPFTKQVQMFCTYIESQSFYANREMENKIESQGYLTGLEIELPESEKQVSIADAMETNLEIFDTLVRLLHHKAKGKIENQEIKSYQDISPFRIPSIEEIMYLSLHRGLLGEIWSNVKYRDWDFERVKDETNNYFHYYCPPNKEDYKRERVAITRYKYRDFINYSKQLNYKEISEVSKELQKKSVFSLTSPSSIFDLEEDVFSLAEKIIKDTVDIAWGQMEDDLGLSVRHIQIGKKKNIKLNELYDGFKYLLSLAYVYRTNTHSNFDDKDFTYLSPIFKLNDIKEHFSNLYKISIEKASDIIELFVFRPNPPLDIFSQPLVYSGSDRVVFTPYIITQMNLNRIVNKHLSFSGIDIASKGIELEEAIREILSFSKHFAINTSKVKFEAYDGKDVEYDLIANFDGKIILIELKCLNKPFSQKEMKQREDDILYGVSQVKRREDILIKQWEEVQRRMNISLPVKSPQTDDIVKIVCTNIFEFTGRIEEDVYITDVSSLIKFFLNPKVEEVKVDQNSTSILNEVKLWSGEPELEDLINYLRSPIATGKIIEKLKEVPRPIFTINEDDPRLAFFDYVLEENPYDLAAFSQQKGSYQGKKVGRNKPCPCGSNKKFKKCHGENL
ncbi:SEC-C domain-containing protein [Priestia aryabhattai]|uniref:YecA family protein n=1 Tax=Priestia aryabhattai TaxID=412384 RepID=UPI003D2CD638